jgi:hypothetical protein
MKTRVIAYMKQLVALTYDTIFITSFTYVFQSQFFYEFLASC